ncbi:hypothetical protein UlMin_005164 [Ulmus minor]
MNDHKLDYQEQFEQNHALIISDHHNFDYNSRSSSQFFGAGNNMGIFVQQKSTMEDQARTQIQNFGFEKSSTTTIMSRFESPASAFYATERCMGFPQYDCQAGYPSQFPSGQSLGENFAIVEPNFDVRASLQPNGKSHLSGYQSNQSEEKSNGISFSNMPENRSFASVHKLHVDSPSAARRHFRVPSKENQDLTGYFNSFGSSLAQLSFNSHQEKQSPRLSSGNSCIGSVNSSSTGPAISSKTRIRWNQDLHEKFVECVNRLGGAEKATPKAILKLMDSEGLTIFHVKSHLQKYRIAKYLPDSAEGKSEKRNSINLTPQLEATTGVQIKEALQLQLDVQRRLHEQLENQRNLQLRVEEQGRQLKMMFDMQQKQGNSLFKADNTSPESDDAPSNSTDEVLGNSYFPFKIS